MPTNDSQKSGGAGVMGRRDVIRASAIVAGGAASSVSAEGAPAQTPGGRSIISTPLNAVVETVSGKVRGYTESGIFTFKGIPYAAHHGREEPLSATAEGSSVAGRAELDELWARLPANASGLQQ